MSKDYYRILDERSVGVVELRLHQDMDAMLFDGLLDSLGGEVDRRAGGAWVLDLSEVGYLSSAGLGLLVNIRQKVRQSRGKLALCGLSPKLVELFRSCCLERLFVIVKTRTDAVAVVSR
jgi:anti-anti-sigma factor